MIAASILLLLAPPPVRAFMGAREPSGRSDEGREPDGEGLRLIAALEGAIGPVPPRLFPGHCMRVEVSLVDRLGGAAPREQEILLEATSSRQELGVFSDESCLRVTNMLRLARGFSTASVYVRSRDGLARESVLRFRESSLPDGRMALSSELALDTRQAEWTRPVLLSTRVREPQRPATGRAPEFTRRPIVELTPAGALYLSWSELPPPLSIEPRPAIGAPGPNGAAAPPLLRLARSTKLWSSPESDVGESALWESLQPPVLRDGAPEFLHVREENSPRMLLGWRADGDGQRFSLEFSTTLIDGDSPASSPALSWMTPMRLGDAPAERVLGDAGAALAGRADHGGFVTTNSVPLSPASLLLLWSFAEGPEGFRSTRFDFDSAEVGPVEPFGPGRLPSGRKIAWLRAIAPVLHAGVISVWIETVEGGDSRLWAGSTGAASPRLLREGARQALSSADDRVIEAALATNGYDRVGVFSLEGPARSSAGPGPERASESLVLRSLALGAKASESDWNADGGFVESAVPGMLREPALAMDRRGQVCAAWVRRSSSEEGLASRWELRFAVHGEDARAWDLPLTLASGVREISRVKLAVDASGNAILAWVEGTPETGEVLRARRLIQGEGWLPVQTFASGLLPGDRGTVPRAGTSLRSYELKLDRDTGFAALAWMEEGERAATFSLSLLR